MKEVKQGTGSGSSTVLLARCIRITASVSAPMSLGVGYNHILNL